MSFYLENRQISTIWVIDDDPNARDSYGFTLEDMGLEARPVTDLQDGTLAALRQSVGSTGAVLCDYHLKKRDYSRHNGDYVVARCFQKGIPGVLCTSIHGAPINRQDLRYIPGWLKTSPMNETNLRGALEHCIEELTIGYRPSRRPWRTLVRVDNMDEERRGLTVVVPAWSTRTKIQLHFDDIPENIHELAEPDRRFHAHVNIGAEDSRDLYFCKWEPQ